MISEDTEKWSHDSDYDSNVSNDKSLKERKLLTKQRGEEVRRHSSAAPDAAFLRENCGPPSQQQRHPECLWNTSMPGPGLLTPNLGAGT